MLKVSFRDPPSTLKRVAQVAIEMRFHQEVRSCSRGKNQGSPERTVESHCAHNGQLHLGNDQPEVQNEALKKKMTARQLNGPVSTT